MADVREMLGGLGKPTLRGVKKCPKCGTYNGTRGIACKNVMCDAVFKGGVKRVAHSVEAVRIITGSSVQVYSVRLRDRGPDYRGFVEVVNVNLYGGSQILDTNNTHRLLNGSRCYIESCCKMSHNDVSSDETEDVCTHLKQALKTTSIAQPLALKNSVLNNMDISNELKKQIWQLATETTGPLVQRVTTEVFVVKCKSGPRHPLGFLHAMFTVSHRKKDKVLYRFHCSCREMKSQKHGTGGSEERQCVHYHASICAFSSDPGLSEEFSNFIDNKQTGEVDEMIPVSCDQLVHQDDSAPERSVAAAILEQTMAEENSDPAEDYTSVCGVEKPCLQTCTISTTAVDDGIGVCVPLLHTSIPDVDTVLIPATTKRRKRPHQDHNLEINLCKDSGLLLQNPSLKKPLIAQKKPTKYEPLGETAAAVSFEMWLATVTERINQTMHYQFDGAPEPLVFHTYEMFFDILQQRIAGTLKKKRLPNSTTAFIRRDALPLGTFTKYTWNITNVFHVKKIFDSLLVPLALTRSFLQNRDGTFCECEPLKTNDFEPSLLAQKLTNNTPIRPREFKTFLKVGIMHSHQVEATPFIIEWIPNILPVTKIGELSIKFEYGHQHNGQIEQRLLTDDSVPVTVQLINDSIDDIPIILTEGVSIV